MLEKFSVRKPFTVLVGVIIVIVLGVVSFMNTSTDLFPEMDLPFAAIFTTYIGATPEQVEQGVTIPIEARMSTLSGIDTVQSISNEHVSIVILQFVEETNMDSASLEIREALDMLVLPDAAARPSLMRFNPEMLPIMSAALHMEGVNIDELSEFARNEIAPALEGVPGVAVVSLSGLIQNQLHVVLRGEKVDALNAQLNIAVMGMIDAMMQDLTTQAETLIIAAVQAFSETRMVELMAGGMSQENAAVQLEQELPAATAEITADVMEALAGGMEGNSEGMGAIAIPQEMLSVETIAGMLTAQNFAMPAGIITEGNIEYMVRVGDRFESLDEIGDMLIFDPAQFGLVGMAPIRLSDVADVFLTDNSDRSFARVNGNPSVMLTIQRQSEFSTTDIASAVRVRMDELEDAHAGLGFVILMDQGEMIDMMISTVLDDLLIGGILAIIILLLFLRDIRPTIIVAVSIPVSLMLAFTLMYFTGVSLNMVSMGGLALSVGMLVDNSIVVIENIYRMRRTTDRSPARAAISGARQVAGSIFAASLTTISVFFPIVFTGGITRQLFTDLALTITYSLLASLIIALTVVPAASSVLLKGVRKEKEGKLWSKFTDAYEKSLRFALRFKPIVLIVVAAAFALSIWLIARQGMILFPPMDAPQITATFEMPDGSTFDDAVAAAEEISAQVLEIRDVETVGVSIGAGGMMGMMGLGGGFGGGGISTTITMYVILEEGRSITHDEVAAYINTISEGMGIEASVAGADGGMGMMAGLPVSLRVEGLELDAIRDTAIDLAEMLATVDGVINITDVTESAAPELRVSVDKDAAMAQGLTVAQVFLAVNRALTTPERTMDVILQGRSYEIVITDGDFEALDWAGVENLQIATPSGEFVTLSDIATVSEDTGFTSITRMNRSRFVTINAELADGFNVSLVNAEIERRLEDFVAQPGVSIHIGGEAEAIADAFNDLLLMLLLALIFIYLIMVAQFQSLVSPFIIMFSIPLAFTGGFFALTLVGMPLSIVAMIGLILLTGVVTNTGIVFLSRVKLMRWEGMPKKEALVDAGRKRLRPVLMTEISTIFAMSVIALGIGEGAEMMQPMAIAIIGGLVYAAITVLYVIPILYDLLHRDKDITKENLDDDVVDNV